MRQEFDAIKNDLRGQLKQLGQALKKEQAERANVTQQLMQRVDLLERKLSGRMVPGATQALDQAQDKSLLASQLALDFIKIIADYVFGLSRDENNRDLIRKLKDVEEVLANLPAHSPCQARWKTLKAHLEPYSLDDLQNVEKTLKQCRLNAAHPASETKRLSRDEVAQLLAEYVSVKRAQAFADALRVLREVTLK